MEAHEEGRIEMRRLKFDNFYFRSSLYTILSLGASALNYLLYPALTRVLSPREFGDFAAIMAISAQIMAILLTFNLTSIYLVKKYPEDEAREKVQVIQNVLIWLFLGATLLLLFAAPLVKERLHLADPLAFGILALFLLVAVPTTIWVGYLQGHNQILKVGVSAVAAALAKLAFALLLASLWGMSGALWGVLIGGALGVVVVRLIAGMRLPSLRSSVSYLSKTQGTFLGGILGYVVWSAIVVGALGVLQNIDIVYAKALFSPTVAGVYSGISVLSNALYFVSFVLIWIVLPALTMENPRHNRRLLRTAYALLGVMAAGAVLGEFLLRGMLPTFLLGNAFGGQGNVLIIASLYQVTLVGATLYGYYLLVLRRKRALLLAGCVFLPIVAAPVLFPPSTTEALITTLLLALLLGWTLYGIIRGVWGAMSHTREQTHD
jgi:O-antigen/teichoic acid export membrane protein